MTLPRKSAGTFRAQAGSGRIATGVLVLAALLLSAGLAEGRGYEDQKDKGPELRTVHGTVVDKDGQATPDSVVYLMNLKTQAVRTYITDSAGSYHFSGLDPNVDYEARAEKGDAASSSRTISSYDSRRDIDVTLKLDRKRPEH